MIFNLTDIFTFRVYEGSKNVEVQVHNILDVRELGRLVKKVALDNVGIQI
jgi:hypothetical protein